MLSTVILAVGFVAMLLASVVLWALFLGLGLRWAKVPHVTLRRVVVTTAIVIGLQIGINVAFLFASPSSDLQSTVLAVIELAMGVAVACVVIRTVFKIPFWRAFLAWLPTMLSNVIAVIFILIVFRPYAYEAFTVPTNSMAPTLIGKHWQGICPECGRPNYCSPRDERYSTREPLLMICDGFHVTEASDVDETVRASDRFMVAKFLVPRRWDLVVFHYPEDPATLYVMRLVGLPGETVHIQDGSVWIDGKRQTPPDALRGIEYLSELPGWFGPDLWGSTSRPASLDDDEYFVLGDFSARSKDSRLWERGAPGHNPYAVPKSYMDGVVTHTYWPPHRWRIHR